MRFSQAAIDEETDVQASLNMMSWQRMQMMTDVSQTRLTKNDFIFLVEPQSGRNQFWKLIVVRYPRMVE